MGDTISWADYSRKWHRAWKTPPSCGYSTFYCSRTPLFAHTSPCMRRSIDLGKAVVLLCSVVLLGGKQLLLWEGTKMQSDACVSQLLACTVKAGSTASTPGSRQGQKQRQVRPGLADQSLASCTRQCRTWH